MPIVSLPTDPHPASRNVGVRASLPSCLDLFYFLREHCFSSYIWGIEVHLTILCMVNMYFSWAFWPPDICVLNTLGNKAAHRWFIYPIPWCLDVWVLISGCQFCGMGTVGKVSDRCRMSLLIGKISQRPLPGHWEKHLALHSNKWCVPFILLIQNPRFPWFLAQSLMHIEDWKIKI